MPRFAQPVRAELRFGPSKSSSLLLVTTHDYRSKIWILIITVEKSTHECVTGRTDTVSVTGQPEKRSGGNNIGAGTHGISRRSSGDK